MTLDPGSLRVTAPGAPSARPSALRVLGLAVLLLPAFWQVISVAWIMVSRRRFPADIEWLESSLLYVAYRLEHGMRIYGPPPGFLTMSHPPLSYVLIAAVGHVWGLDYGTARALSIFWALVGATTLGYQVWRASDRRENAVVDTAFALGWFGVAFYVSGTVFDLVRDDSMGNALVLLASACIARGHDSYARRVACGLLLVAAMYTRITTAPECAWIVCFVFWRSRRAGLTVAAIAAAVGLGILGVLQARTGGGFFARTVGVYVGQSVSLRAAVLGFGSLMLFAPATPLLAVALLRSRTRRVLSPASVFWIGLSFVALPQSLVPFAKIGGWYNDWVPFLTIAWPTLFIVAEDLLRGGVFRDARRVRWVVWIAASVLLVARVRDPRRWVPSAHAWAEVDRLARLVRGLEGGVAMPDHPFFAVRNGQPAEQIMSGSYVDLAWGGQPCPVDVAIRQLPVRWILVDQEERANAAEWYLRAFAPVDRPVPAVPPLTGAILYPVQLAERRVPAP